MIYPSIDKLNSRVGSKFLLVNLVIKRAEEMDTYKHYQMEEKDYKSKKNIGKVLEEIANELISLK